MAKDHEGRSRELALEFETLCARILKAAGYIIDREWRAIDAPDATWRFDFVAAKAGRGQTEQRIIDVKWMPLPEITLRVAHNIASLYSPIRGTGGVRRRTLILSATIASASQLWVEGEYATDIWGRDQLRQFAGDTLRKELDAFLSSSDGWYAKLQERPPIIVAKPLREAAREDAQRQTERADAFAMALASDPTELKANGAALCAELHALPPGKKAAYRYEQLIDRIFAFLFPADLVRTGPSTIRTEDGLNIYDLVFQIRNRSRFWTNLSRDLRSRVMLVECKNYSKQIEAMQIYTTERYLSPSALRSIALIVTRKAPRPDAVQAASGALRESGKLMLILDDAAICAMLHARDTQLSKTGPDAEENDPAEVIDARLHQFLATLSR